MPALGEHCRLAIADLRLAVNIVRFAGLFELALGNRQSANDHA